MTGLPYPPYLRFIILRSAVLWLLVRAAFFFMIWFGAAFSPHSFRDALEQPTYGLPAVLVWLDRRFFHEILLPANLGTWEGWLWGTSAGVALALDLIVGMLLSA